MLKLYQMHLSQSEENYIKSIFRIEEETGQSVTTNAVADLMETKAASVTDMIKKLSEKELLEYEKYRGVQLSKKGTIVAKNLVRKHRLWEYFLVEKLHFKWDEVHDIAEQLEHIKSPLLIERLDKYLGFPSYDPHGDPIPDENGNINYHQGKLLANIKEGETGIIEGVKDSSASFLQYLDRINIGLGSQIKVLEIYSFDLSMLILINGKTQITISALAAQNLYVKPSK